MVEAYDVERLKEILAAAYQSPIPWTYVKHGWSDNVESEQGQVASFELDTDAHLAVAAVNALPALLARIAELEQALGLPAEVLAVMKRMDFGYGFPASDVAQDTGLRIDQVRAVYRALHAFGWAFLHPFHDEDEPRIRGRGYSLTSAGIRARATLERAQAEGEE